MFLAGDIGGTKTLLALVTLEEGRVVLGEQRRYVSRAHAGLGEVIDHFLAGTGARVDGACFGVAGPVVDNTCVTPNLPWVIDGGLIGRERGIPKVSLINDFSAVVYGLDALGPADLCTVQAGLAVPRGPVGVLGAGTGLGQGFALWTGAAYEVWPSEGGHADFAPRTEDEWGVLEFTREELGGRVSLDRILCGQGLVRIYRYLVERKGWPGLGAVATVGEEQAPAVISAAGLAGDPTCEEVLDLFMGIYGAEAGNLALRLLATGGIYIAGGVAPRLREKLLDGVFMEAFLDKGRLRGVMESIPVHLVQNPEVGLLGAAVRATRP